MCAVWDEFDFLGIEHFNQCKRSIKGRKKLLGVGVKVREHFIENVEKLLPRVEFNLPIRCCVLPW